MTTSLDHGRFWRDLAGVRPKVIADLRERVLPLFCATPDLPACPALLAELSAWRTRWGLSGWTETYALETLEQWALFGSAAPPLVLFHRVKSKRQLTEEELVAQGEQLALDASASVEEAVKDQLLAEKYRRDQRAHKAKIAANEKATHERHVQAGEARAAERWADRPAMWASWQKSATKLWRHDANLSTYKVAHLIADATGHPWRTIEKHINKPV